MIEIQTNSNHNQAKILVIGVGGGGNNALTMMSDYGIEGVQLIALNTDVQHLDKCNCDTKLQIGEKLTKGLGAGANPEIGEKAAQESQEQIEEAIADADMVILTCGMGGGTGTGATPFIAGLAKGMDKLTVAVVTKPFTYEGKPRMQNALDGIERLKTNVDSIIVVSNDRLLSIADKNISFKDGLKKADEVLLQMVMAITDIVYKTQDITLDFADIRTAMSNKGTAHIGIGVGRGDNKAKDAVNAAVNSPMLETSIQGASDLLVNVSGDSSFPEVTEAFQYLQSLVGEDTRMFNGYDSTVDQPGEIKVTIIATGVAQAQPTPEKKIIPPKSVETTGFNPKSSAMGMNYTGNPVYNFKMPEYFNSPGFVNGGFSREATHKANDSFKAGAGYAQENNIDGQLLNNGMNQIQSIDIPDFVRYKGNEDR